MPIASVGEIELDYERSGSGPPLLLIMGMSGTALHWGEPFLDALRERLRDDRLRPPRRGREQPSEGPVTIAQMAERRRRAARGAGDRLGARAGHLDGRDGRPGARARAPRARAHAHARLHLLRRRGQLARARPRSDSGWSRRCARATASSRCASAWEINVSAAMAADEDALADSSRSPTERAVAVPVVMAQPQACARARHAARACPALSDAHARDPRHRRSDAARRERPPDRLADPGLAPRDPRRTSATCSSGSGPSARRSCCARTPPCPLERRSCVRHRTASLLVGRRQRRARQRAGRSCCCTGSPPRAATW